MFIYWLYLSKNFLKNKEYLWEFSALPVRGVLNNKKLGIDSTGLVTGQDLDNLKRDLIMILLHGASALNSTGADLEKCEVSNYLGNELELDNFIRQRYIWVSRITGGATTNSQGQIAQSVVRSFLRKLLDESFLIRSGSIVIEGYGKEKGMPFDIIIERNNKAIGIEVSFQVTTNSVIERKGGQAQSRQELMHKNGNKIAYVIDGAGNFQRRSAVETICNYSDCTVAFTESEFKKLVLFVQETL